jgi:Cd2+/Zn2+-exporting ATPase
MDCPDCARRIQDRLCRLDGVEEAVGNPVSRRLRVSFDPSRIDDERVRAEIGRLGYLARPDEGGAADEEVHGTWTGPDAVRTYGATALFLLGLVLAWLAPGGPLVRLPLHDLHLPDVLFLLAAGLGGWNFFPAGVRAARALSLDMNFLMTVAILGAVGVGEFLEAGAIAFLFSLAELLETYSVDRARASLSSLLDLSPDRASVIREGREVTVPAGEVGVGETVVVRPGDRVPVDGTVTEGASAVNQATITGESMPVDKARGDEVYAGTINGDGYLRVRTDRAAENSTLARIIHLVEEAEGLKAPSERFVDRFARFYTPAVTVAAVLLTAVPPLLFGAPFETWFVRGLTLLVIACPCALVISTPVAVVSGITAAARNGVLIKGGVHLEALGEVEVFAMDKTGTLTAGHPEVTDVVPLDDGDPDELLALAAAVEAHSQHPVARAVVREARHRGLDPDRWRVEDFEDLRGKGVRARLDGREVRVGLPALFGGGSDLGDRIGRLRSQGKTTVVVGRPDRPLGLIAVADRPREEAARALRRLREAGVGRIVMLTGDNRATAGAIGDELGFDEVHADLLPEEKVERVRELEARYGPVAMVGDGVNDGPALAAATVGIAMGVAGSDAALETADVALMGDELDRLPYVFELSRRARGVIRQNIGASLGVKFLLAAGVPLGWVSLVVAVLVGDMGASLGVTGNSLRLARVRASPAGG